MYRFGIVILTGIVLLFNINFALAVSFEDFSGLNKIAGEDAAGYDTSKTNLPATIGTVIQYVLSFLGVIMLAIVLISYFIMSNAGGDEELVIKSKKWIKNGIIGILIVLAAYMLTAIFIKFFANEVLNAGS